MKEETKIELMKIAASLTHDTTEHMITGLSVGKASTIKPDILVIFSTCLNGIKEQFDNLDQQ
jgi:hypothetical protein